jgi:hypothetical protein
MSSAFRAAFAALAIGVCTLSGADFFPQQLGNSWTYREAATGQSFTVRVGTPVFINNRVYQTLQGYTNAVLMVRQDERKQLIMYNESAGVEQILTSFEPFEGGWWEAPTRPCEQLGQTLFQRGRHDGPAGPFADVLEIRYRVVGCADTGVVSEQYAENIGMVRRVVTTFAGPRQYDLVYARIGNSFIEASPYGRFTVSVENRPAAGPLTVTLRLQTNFQYSQILSFPTAQEYDVELRDSAGQLIWAWSQGKFFLQAAHQRTIGGEWTVSVAVPRPPAVGFNPVTIHGWLTTTGVPRYAATVPLLP